MSGSRSYGLLGGRPSLPRREFLFPPIQLVRTAPAAFLIATLMFLFRHTTLSGRWNRKRELLRRFHSAFRFSNPPPLPSLVIDISPQSFVRPADSLSRLISSPNLHRNNFFLLPIFVPREREISASSIAFDFGKRERVGVSSEVDGNEKGLFTKRWRDGTGSDNISFAGLEYHFSIA